MGKIDSALAFSLGSNDSYHYRTMIPEWQKPLLLDIRMMCMEKVYIHCIYIHTCTLSVCECIVMLKM